MLFKNIILISLSAVALANQAVPNADNNVEAPQDIKKLKPKCPEHHCPKPKYVTLTKNITKQVYKTVTKEANQCKPTKGKY